MEQQNKRQLKDLLKDRTFLYSIPIFLILVGSFIWYMAPPDKNQDTQPGSGLNTFVPTAHNDSLSANKLDLQTETVNSEEERELKLQAIPGSNERYVYGSRYRPASGSINRLDSLYQVGNGRPSGSSGIPDRLPPSKPSPVPSMLKEENFTLDENEGGGTLP